MDNTSKRLWTKIWQFLITSGFGFILDFSVYTILTSVFDLRVFIANILSSIVGATFSFIVSTHKVFETRKSRIPLFFKYILYIIYQIILIIFVSVLGDRLDVTIMQNINFPLIRQYHKLFCKMLITPITMTCNFIVMRTISEKI